MRSSTFIACVSLLVLAAQAVVGTVQVARAQSATTDWVQDRPSQRLLPLPQGKGASDPYQMAERLRQIRDRVRDGTKGALPKLSGEQLRQLDDISRQWQDTVGDMPLPSWDSIPKELIDSALADPEQRRQAQRLLEQYARQRQLPAAGSGLELPRHPQAPNDSTPTSSEASDAAPGSKSTAATSEQSRSEHDKALQELLSKLRAVEAGQRASRAASTDAQADFRLNPGRLQDARSKAVPASDARSPSGPDHQPANSGLRDAPSPAADGQAAGRALQPPPGTRGQSNQSPRGAAPPQPPSEGAEVGFDESERSLSRSSEEQNSGTQTADIRRPRANGSTNQPDASNGARSRTANARGENRADRAETSARAPADDSNPFDFLTNPTNGTSLDKLNGGSNEAFEDFDSATAQAQQSEDSSSLDNTGPPQAQRPAVPPTASASTSSGSTSQDALQQDIRKQIERFGLGLALRRIAVKAFKEQIADARKSVDASTGSPPSATRQRTDIKVSSSANSNTNNRPSVNKAPGGTQPRETSSTASDSSMAAWAKGWSDAIGDVLKSLATVPGASREADAASSSATATTPGWKPELSWHGRGIETFAAVILIGLLCVALLSMRKRLAVTSSMRSSERSWAKEVLAEGIRTRADVVRAFHRLVLRTTQPVAAWWTHRYAANRLSESRPQLSEAMQELSSAYEQARYMPPEADLSDEQLNRVRVALQQCAAYRVSNAST